MREKKYATHEWAWIHRSCNTRLLPGQGTSVQTEPWTRDQNGKQEQGFLVIGRGIIRTRERERGEQGRE